MTLKKNNQKVNNRNESAKPEVKVLKETGRERSPDSEAKVLEETDQEKSGIPEAGEFDEAFTATDSEQRQEIDDLIDNLTLFDDDLMG